MHNFTSRLGAAIAALAACASLAQGANAAAPTAQQHAKNFAHRGTGGARAAKGQSLLYVSAYVGNSVDIYTAVNGRTQLGQITNGVSKPIGLAADKQGNVYVANSGNNTVTEYAPGGTAPIFTYSSGLNYPDWVAVDRQGNVYISNLFGGNVLEFPPGSQTASRTITFTGQTPEGVAVDAKGNLYVGEQAGSAADVVVFAPGSSQGTNLGLQGLCAINGVALSRSGNLAVYDPTCSSLTVFPKGQVKASRHYYGANFGPAVAWNGDGQRIFGTDSTEGRVIELIYPYGNFVNVIEGIEAPEGLVVVPPAQ